MARFALILLFFISSIANAEIVPKSDPVYGYAWNGYTADTACGAIRASGTNLDGSFYSSSSSVNDGTSGPFCCTGGSCFAPAQTVVITPAECPEGYTDIGNNQCEGTPPVNCNDPARNLQGQSYGGSGAMPSSICVAGCEYGLISGYSGCKDGVCNFGATVGAASGNTCSGAESSPYSDLTPEQQCTANGQGYVSTNGVVSCVGAGTAGGGDVTSNNAGSTSSPTALNSGGIDTNGDGQADQSKEEYCAQHPTASFCKSSFSGNCNDGFICDGDAVNCAMAKTQFQANCKLFDVENTESILGKAAVNGTDLGTLTNPALPNNREVIAIASTLNESDRGINGTLSDVTVSVGAGRPPITLEFSKLVPYLTYMGYIVLGFAYFRAYKIVGGQTR